MSIKGSRPVYRVLRQLVLNRHFADGVPINLRELEAIVGLSSIPIREAMIELAKDDLIDFVPGRGFFARQIDIQEACNTIELIDYLLRDAAVYIREDLNRIVNIKNNYDIKNTVDFKNVLERIILEQYRMPHGAFLVNAIDRILANFCGEHADILKFLALYLERVVKETDIDDIKMFISEHIQLFQRKIALKMLPKVLQS